MSGLLLPHPCCNLRGARCIWASLFAIHLVLAGHLYAATGGSVSGMVRDPSGAVIAGAELLLVNPGQQTEYRTRSDKWGSFSFPNLPVGQYNLTISAPGFATQCKTHLTVDADSALDADATLAIGTKADTITVTSSPPLQVDTIATHLGEVVSGQQLTALPLNGRSYTDLLAIQPGVAPISTLLPSSVVMAGATGSLSPSGDLNPGNLSINGQRESSNGFLGSALAGWIDAMSSPQRALPTRCA